MNGAYQQLGYVTNDFERAIDLFRKLHELGPFKEMRELTIGARAGQSVTAHFALAFKDATQFEIIQPLDGDCTFYSDVLPDTAFAVRFHHLGHYYPKMKAFQGAKARCADRWPNPVDVTIFDGTYAYFNAREDLGHYLELFSFPPATHFEGVPRYG